MAPVRDFGAVGLDHASLMTRPSAMALGMKMILRSTKITKFFIAIISCSFGASYATILFCAS